jgi:hypothetical protein
MWQAKHGDVKFEIPKNQLLQRGDRDSEVTHLNMHSVDPAVPFHKILTQKTN